ncbi:MAG TPA: sugar phosphate isomerase/epimerase [Bryobacteraceae bacterium]|nr:sugar phosphate isomerase/epimerase [Bryobacteraceae bacterium]
MNRRDFGKLAAGAMAAGSIGLGAKRINSRIDGVQIGAQTYSFRDRSLDACIAGMVEVGLGEAEVWDGHITPKGAAAAKDFRMNPPIRQMYEVRDKFDNAGIELYALTYAFEKDWTDKEIEGIFEIAKALGVRYITSSSKVSVAKRVDPVAQKYQITVAFHNHSNKAPDEFARPEDFETALSGASKYLAINLDIGHFTGAGYDPVSFLEQHHDRIVTLHLKDKTLKDANMPWGQGDTKIKEVLAVLKTKRYPIPANIEYEYKGADTIEEVKKCYAYCKAALA